MRRVPLRYDRQRIEAPGGRRVFREAEDASRPIVNVDFPYFATVVPGLEKVAEEEIRSLSKKAKFGPEMRGAIVFDANLSPEELLKLRCIEDAFATLALIQSLSRDETGIRQIHKAVYKSALWDSALESHRQARPLKKRRMTYRVVAQLEGYHDFRRMDMKHAAEDAVDQRMRGAWSRIAENAAIELWVRTEEDRSLIGFRLSDNEMRHRTYKVAQLPASLKPTVAAAMARLTYPQPEDVFLDPMCGSGTILIERALAGRYSLILGGDADPEALDATKANVGPRYQPLRIQPMDVRRLPLETASVDKIASNLPFGYKISVEDDLPALYEAAFSEFARALKPGGRAVLLVAREGGWKDILQNPKYWTPRRRLQIDLLGQRPTILVLDRNYEPFSPIKRTRSSR